MRPFLLTVILAVTMGAASPVTSSEASELPAYLRVQQQVFSRFDRVGWEGLTKPERTYYAVSMLLMEVNHGGFEYYYWYGGANTARAAAEALSEIGAARTRDLLLRANAYFPRSNPPGDMRARQVLLAPLGDRRYTVWKSIDQEFYKDPDGIDSLLERYYESHKHQFHEG